MLEITSLRQVPHAAYYVTARDLLYRARIIMPCASMMEAVAVKLRATERDDTAFAFIMGHKPRLRRNTRYLLRSRAETLRFAQG